MNDISSLLSSPGVMQSLLSQFGLSQPNQKQKQKRERPYSTIEKVKLEGIERDIYSCIFLHLDIEDLLEFRCVSKGFRTLVDEITPSLCEINNLPVTNHFFQYCLMIGGNDSIESLMNVKVSSVTKILSGLPRRLRRIRSNFDINMYIDKIISTIEEKFQLLLSKDVNDTVSSFGITNFKELVILLTIIMLGNINLISTIWKDEIKISILYTLDLACRSGNLRLLSIIISSYPKFIVDNDIDLELWLDQQIISGMYREYLFKCCLVAERLDLCDRLINYWQSDTFADNIESYCLTQKVYDWIDSNFKIEDKFNLLCSISDVNKELLLSVCDGQKLGGDNLADLFDNGRFDCIMELLPKITLIDCTNLNQLLYLSYFDYEKFDPLLNLDIICHIRLLKSILIKYDEIIDWKDFCRKKVSGMNLSIDIDLLKLLLRMDKSKDESERFFDEWCQK